MVLERMAVLGLDLDVWGLVVLEMLGALLQRVLEYLGPLRGLVWVLLLGVIVLGLVFLLSLVAQGSLAIFWILGISWSWSWSIFFTARFVF